MNILNFQTNRLNRLYKSYHKMVFNICIRYTKDNCTARDLTHDIFIKVNNNLQSFKRQSRYSTWIYSIASNYCLDYLRNNKRRKLLLEEPKNYLWDQESQSTKDTFNQAVIGLELERYPETTRRVLYMRYVLGLTHQDIAKELDISRVAVTKRLQNHQRKSEQRAQRDSNRINERGSSPHRRNRRDSE